MDKTVIVEFHNLKNGTSEDLEIPLNITADELYEALDQTYGLNGLGLKGRGQNYLKCENPIALLKGNRNLDEFGLRDGSTIIFS